MCKRLQPLNIQFAFQLLSTKTIKKTIKKEHRENISTQHKKVQNFVLVKDNRLIQMQQCIQMQQYSNWA